MIEEAMEEEAQGKTGEAADLPDDSL